VLCSVSLLFRNVSGERSFEEVRNERSSGGLLAIKKEEYRVYSATLVNVYSERETQDF